MRYVFGFLCVCALGILPLVGCGDEGPAPECRSAQDCEDKGDCFKRHCTDGVCRYTTSEYEGDACGLSLGRCRSGTCVLEGVRNPITGEECSATPPGDGSPSSFLVALVFVGIWWAVRRSARRM